MCKNNHCGLLWPCAISQVTRQMALGGAKMYSSDIFSAYVILYTLLIATIWNTFYFTIFPHFKLYYTILSSIFRLLYLFSFFMYVAYVHVICIVVRVSMSVILSFCIVGWEINYYVRRKLRNFVVYKYSFHTIVKYTS